MKRAALVLAGMFAGSLVLGPALATDGTHGTSGYATRDKDTISVAPCGPFGCIFDSQDPPHTVVLPHATKTLTGHGTSTVSTTDICTVAPGAGECPLAGEDGKIPGTWMPPWTLAVGPGLAVSTATGTSTYSGTDTAVGLFTPRVNVLRTDTGTLTETTTNTATRRYHLGRYNLPDCYCSGSTYGGASVLRACGNEACGSDGNIYRCASQGSWSYTGRACAHATPSDIAIVPSAAMDDGTQLICPNPALFGATSGRTGAVASFISSGGAAGVDFRYDNPGVFPSTWSSYYSAFEIANRNQTDGNVEYMSFSGDPVSGNSIAAIGAINITHSPTRGAFFIWTRNGGAYAARVYVDENGMSVGTGAAPASGYRLDVNGEVSFKGGYMEGDIEVPYHVGMSTVLKGGLCDDLVMVDTDACSVEMSGDVYASKFQASGLVVGANVVRGAGGIVFGSGTTTNTTTETSLLQNVGSTLVISNTATATAVGTVYATSPVYLTAGTGTVTTTAVSVGNNPNVHLNTDAIPGRIIGWSSENLSDSYVSVSNSSWTDIMSKTLSSAAVGFVAHANATLYCTSVSREMMIRLTLDGTAVSPAPKVALDTINNFHLSVSGAYSMAPGSHTLKLQAYANGSNCRVYGGSTDTGLTVLQM
jgi:hypothetical protein